MWVLINNVPINVFDDFYTSTVIEFNKKFVENNVFYFNNSHISGRSKTHIILNVASSKKWFDVEVMEKEEIQKESHSGYPYTSKHYIKKHEDSIGYDEFEFFNIKEGYFFYVSDSKRIIVSELYETKESAQEALEKLLSTVNKIVARLQRVTI